MHLLNHVLMYYLVPVSDVSFLPNYNDGDDPLELKVGEHIECLAEGNPKPR